MSNNTTPEGAHQPLDDGGIDADGIPGGAEVTGGMPTPPELVLTHSSSVCKKVFVDSGNDKTILYVLSIGLEHDNEPQELRPCKRSPTSSDSFEYEVGTTPKQLDTKSND